MLDLDEVIRSIALEEIIEEAILSVEMLQSDPM